MLIVASVEEECAKATGVEKQLVASSELLEKWLLESDEVVTNVRVANDTREYERRTKGQEIRDELLIRLKDESDECMRRFHQINEKWVPLLSSNDPLDIRNAMLEQNAQCLEVLAQKDEVIAALKEELEKADESFFAEQKLQKNDIDLLIERIDHQANFMSKAYRRELVLIENVVENDRKELIDNLQKQWDLVFKKRNQCEADGFERRKAIVRAYEAELRRLMIEHQESYRIQKIWRETECQNLQQQVEQIKALCLLNSEKLHYNYTVLKCREDENTIIKNQQKRKLNKLQDVINNLKKQYAEAKEKTKLEKQSLTHQVKKSHKGIKEMEEKSRMFTIANDQQYMDVWEMNTKAANELVDKIYAADKIIFEQILGLEWKPPPSSILNKEDLPSYVNAVEAIEKKRKSEEIITMKIEPLENLTPEERNLQRQLLHHILQMISDHSGFLIEYKLQDLLNTHSDEEKLIIRLDNVFQALSISAAEQIDIMLHYFFPYCYCPVCSDNKKESSDESTVTIMSESLSYDEKTVDDEKLCPEAQKLVAIVKEESGLCPCDEVVEKSAASNLCSVTEAIESVSTSNDSKTKVDTDTNAEADVTTGPGTDADTDIEIDAITSSSDDKVVCSERVPEKEEKKLCDSNVSKEKHGPRRMICDNGHLLQIQPSMVMKALKEFVASCDSKYKRKAPLTFEEKLREQKLTISRNITAEDVTNYWASYREIFDSSHEQLWDAVYAGLNKYHDILRERHDLNVETECLRRQNEELRRLLKYYDDKAESFMPLSSKSTSQF